MKTLRLNVSLFLIICFLASCSVEKRMYLRGYHVEWNKNENEIASPPEIKIQDAKKPANRIVSNLKKQKIEDLNSQPVSKATFQKPEKRDTSYFIIKKKKGSLAQQNNSRQENDGERKPNRMASISSTLAIVALIGIVISIALGWGLFILFVLPAIPAVVFGVIAVVQCKNEPGVYTNQWKALLGIILGSIETLVLLAFAGIFIGYFF